MNLTWQRRMTPSPTRFSKAVLEKGGLISAATSMYEMDKVAANRKNPLARDVCTPSHTESSTSQQAIAKVSHVFIIA